MFGKIIPREEKFFDHFRESSQLIEQGAEELCVLLANPNGSEKSAEKIKDIEHKADKVTHHIIALLHKTFITPLDREEIHQLISRMDDIIDFIEAAADRIFLFDIKNLPRHAVDLGEVCLKSTRQISLIVSKLENMKDSHLILKACVEIHRLENEADQILRKSLATLFKEETDAREIIKLKEIFELLETVTDRCEDVANIVEGIVLEHT